jgi:hypothetical protein
MTATPPTEFLCPITNDVMREPVIDADGHTYEWSAILRWLQTNPQSPITRRPMTVDELKSNRALVEAIGRWRKAAVQPSAPPPTPISTPIPTPIPTPYYNAAPSPTYVCVNEYPYQVFVDVVPPSRSSQTTTTTMTMTTQSRTLRVLVALAIVIVILVFLFRAL